MRWAGRLDHDDDEEKTHPGAGGPEAHPGRSAAGRRQGRRGRLPGAGRLGADLLPVAEPVRRVEGRRRQEAEGSGAGEQYVEAAACRCGVGEGGVEGDRLGKLLSPARRRAAVHHLIAVMGVSERFACRVTGQHRTTQRYPSVATTPVDPDAGLRQWLRDYAKAHPRWVTGGPTTTPAGRAGKSTTRRSNDCGATKGSECRNAAAANGSAPPPLRR